MQFVAGGDTMRNGYPGYVAAASIAQALGWSGAQVASTYGACATGAQAIDVARARILAGLCEVALVVGADAAPKGFFAPPAATARATPTGSASTCWEPPTRSTSASTRAGGWRSTAPANATSRWSR